MSFKRTHYTSQVNAELEGTKIRLVGWVHEVRDLGGIRFLLLRDREGVVQVTAKAKENPEEIFETIGKLTKESVIAVEGVVKKSSKAKLGVEVIPYKVEVINEALSPLPLDPTGKIPAELNTRLDSRFIDLRRPEEKAVFIIHHHLIQLTREFFSSRGFIEVVTPRILATATEGGATLFSIDYFGSKAYLAQSPQLYKEELTGSLEKVFEIGLFFRAEESNTTYHLNEFLSLDIEEAFADEEDVMKLLEEYLTFIFRGVKERCPNELKTLGRRLEDLTPPFKKLTYDDALEVLRRKGLEIGWGEDLSTPALRILGEFFNEPFFIVDWPTHLKPFYIMPREDDPKLSYSFDLMYGWLEIASGGRRIHRKDQLIKRLEEQGLNPENFKHHLKCYDYGMPPHAGWGLGLARLLMIITGKDDIREVVLYPRDRWRLTP